MARLGRRFYARPAVVVAPALLGRVLVRQLPGGRRLAARIVETEAYREDDPASHSYRGLTPRTRVMFGPPGHLYVYFTYGMHFCMNVVTGRDGEGSAVLLRAAEPVEGLDVMAQRRRTDAPRLLCSGPARLAQAFGVDGALDGADLVQGPMWIERGAAVPVSAVETGPRVGIRRGTETPWRFRVADSTFVSRGAPSRRREPRR